MNARWKGAFIALLISPGVLFAQVGWKTYTNARFGFSLKYPTNWGTKADAPNGAGAEFRSPDGKILVIAQGHFLAGQSLRDFEEALRKRFEGEAITVRQTQRGFILEAVGRTEVTLVHFAARAGNWASLEATSPRGDEDPFLNDIFKSWKPFLEGNYDRAP